MQFISSGDDEGDGGDEHHGEGEEGEELGKVAANTEGYRNTKMQGCCKYRGIQEYNNARLLQIRSTKCNCCKYKDAKELGKVATNMEIVKKSKLFAPNTKMKWRGF